jgi:hypothetical protein
LEQKKGFHGIRLFQLTMFCGAKAIIENEIDSVALNDVDVTDYKVSAAKLPGSIGNSANTLRNSSAIILGCAQASLSVAE